MSLIAAVKSAEERYLAKGGAYTSDFTTLDISYPGMTAGGIPTKFFNAGAAASTCASGPCYVLTVTRQTNSSTVAARYGNYAFNVNVPDAPAVTVSACPGGAGNCNELIQ
jgi:hypothetical protein